MKEIENIMLERAVEESKELKMIILSYIKSNNISKNNSIGLQIIKKQSKTIIIRVIIEELKCKHIFHVVSRLERDKLEMVGGKANRLADKMYQYSIM